MADSRDLAQFFDHARYIKLGAGSSNIDKACIDRGLAYIGFGTDGEDLFKAASTGDWMTFRTLSYERDTAGSDQARKQRATSATNQVKAFFEANDRTLWVTFYAGKLYHGLLRSDDRPKIDVDWGGCTRVLARDWSDIDACGVPLKIENLSGNLTKVRAFQGTSCALGKGQADYLLRRLSGKVPGYITQIDEARRMMVEAVLSAIKSLQPKDFELLVEIIFSRSWRRIGQMGGVEKFIDIVYEDPLNPERRIAVQVKSETTVNQIAQYCKDEQLDLYEKLFFVFHSPERSEMLDWHDTPEKLELIDGDRLANLVVDSGLIHWLKAKTS